MAFASGHLRQRLNGERQKVGGPALATIGRTPPRATRGINPLKGTVADVSHRAIIRTPDFLALSSAAKMSGELAAERREA